MITVMYCFFSLCLYVGLRWVVRSICVTVAYMCVFVYVLCLLCLYTITPPNHYTIIPRPSHHLTTSTLHIPFLYLTVTTDCRRCAGFAVCIDTTCLADGCFVGLIVLCWLSKGRWYGGRSPLNIEPTGLQSDLLRSW